MRAGFLGKGGSGKTTVAAGFVRYCSRDQHVLALDADVNVHLQEAAGVEGSAEKLGQNHEEVEDFVEPDTERTIVHTSPPDDDSRFVKPDPEDEFVHRFGVTDGNISLLKAGSFEHQDISKTCYHGKLEPLEMFVHRLIDSEDDIVVGDMTAGIDNLGNSLAFVYDLNIYVVEPTEKSVEVFKEFEDTSEKLGLKTKVVANKIEDKNDRAFIKDRIPEEKIIGFIERSRDVRRFEQGHTEGMEDFVDSNSETFEKIKKELFETEKNWDEYMAKLKFSHETMGEAWWDDFLDEKISKQTETGFSYRKVLE